MKRGIVTQISPRHASYLLKKGVCMDELTGVQALQRKFPDLPMLSGHVLRREFEYIRHGTLSRVSSISML